MKPQDVENNLHQLRSGSSKSVPANKPIMKTLFKME